MVISSLQTLKDLIFQSLFNHSYRILFIRLHRDAVASGDVVTLGSAMTSCLQQQQWQWSLQLGRAQAAQGNLLTQAQLTLLLI
jgi:hypothetical protein